ncbi:MAG: PilN domain-containing protein [Desulfobulbales bacterium]|nr:PilN domain-containing protein [Desulfobulbales bacterium]
MIQINLLPVREIKKKIRARNQILGLGFTLFAVLAILGLVALFLGFKVGELKASISALNKEKAKYQTTINQIEQLKKDQTLLETKLNTISELKKGSKLTVRVMDELAKLIPSNRLWLKSMNFRGNKLQISGTALDNATIADFMETIVTSPFFVNAELSGTSTTSYAGRALKSFSFTIGVINADYEQEEPAEEPGKQKS